MGAGAIVKTDRRLAGVARIVDQQAEPFIAGTIGFADDSGIGIGGGGVDPGFQGEIGAGLIGVVGDFDIIIGAVEGHRRAAIGHRRFIDGDDEGDGTGIDGAIIDLEGETVAAAGPTRIRHEDHLPTTVGHHIAIIDHRPQAPTVGGLVEGAIGHGLTDDGGGHRITAVRIEGGQGQGGVAVASAAGVKFGIEGRFGGGEGIPGQVHVVDGAIIAVGGAVGGSTAAILPQLPISHQTGLVADQPAVHVGGDFRLAADVVPEPHIGHLRIAVIPGFLADQHLLGNGIERKGRQAGL